MARSGSPPPRRGRGRSWVTRVTSGPDPAPTRAAPAPQPVPQAPSEPVDRYAPRRRYPWHDDPHYDPAAHRRPAGVTDAGGSHSGPPHPGAPAGPAPSPPHPDAPRNPPHAAAPHPRAPQHVAGPGPTAAYPATPPQGPPHPTRATGTSDPSWPPPGPTPPGPTPPGEVPWTAAGPPPLADPPPGAPTPRMPRKLTVTRVAALRSREITGNGIRAFRRAATADGADRSGLTALTYATMMTYAVDAAVAVALANTLFFAAATGESKANVALYLAITVAPFAVVAPVVGPMLDRLQRGRRAALAVSFAGRAVLCVVMALNYDNWLLYPAALGVMVLSKSFQVLKAAVTPRVLPAAITLATTNSRLTTFGLVAGGVFGGVAAAVAALSGSPGALFYTAALGLVGTVLCLRIPRWVESTAGEVPAQLRTTVRGRRHPMGRGVVLALWGNGSIRVLTGFLTLFVAFTVRELVGGDPTQQLLLIGVVGAAAGIGSFAGNFAGARSRFSRADTVVVGCVAGALSAAVAAALLPGIVLATIVALVASTCSALAKVCLDAVVQRDLPEESRASAFGRSETVLQLAWVLGGAMGVLLPHDTWWLGFAVVSAVVALGGLQTALLARGRSVLPFLNPRAAPQPARS